MSEEIKPCLFCGSEAELACEFEHSIVYWFVKCSNLNCGAKGQSFHTNVALDDRREKEQAVNSWNRVARRCERR